MQTYQHGGTEVKLVEELSDKDVDLKLVLLVALLSFTNDVGEPLVLLLSTCDPNEEDLCTISYE